MKVDLHTVEEVAKELYIRALKILPPDIKEGFRKLDERETDPMAKTLLATMIKNIAVAEETHNLTCQDTGVPIYNVT
ncbi:MAG: fumarate hydratase, partial [Azospira oryzae]